jgi:hypothetical protein
MTRLKLFTMAVCSTSLVTACSQEASEELKDGTELQADGATAAIPSDAVGTSTEFSLKSQPLSSFAVKPAGGSGSSAFVLNPMASPSPMPSS